MSNYNTIQEQIAQLQPHFELDTVPLNNAFNRILQEDVLADMDMPPFNKSAMDGYACRLEDIGNELEVLEVVNAGSLATKAVGKNQCVKIMTGAAVPSGCDCVFKVEESEELGNNRVRCTNTKTNRNICYLGEDYNIGEVLLKKGAIIRSSQMAVLAGAGYGTVKVSALPKVSIIATGSELVAPNAKPGAGKIRNSNASQLIAQLKQLYIEVQDNLQLKDDYKVLTSAFLKAVDKNDFVFFTGGASVGDFDFIPEILKEQGFKTYWNRTGIKPGNPMTFSEKEGKYCFGLSGNPVSSLIQFELFSKPAIYKLLGANYKALRIKAEMAFDYSRKKADRLGIVPVQINAEGQVESIPFHGSAHINALSSANALLEIPLGITQINKGELAYVRPL